jgi:hypothetical protein
MVSREYSVVRVRYRMSQLTDSPKGRMIVMWHEMRIGPSRESCGPTRVFHLSGG